MRSQSQVQVAVDAADLAADFGIPAAHQAQRRIKEFL